MFPLQKQTKVSCCLFIFLSLVSIGHTATIRELYESAVSAYNQTQYDQAIEMYQEIIKTSPQFAPAYVGIGLALKDKGADIEEVLYYYKLAVVKDPTNSQALEQLGRLYYSLGKLDKAQGVFEKALKINPNMLDVKVSLGWTYLIGKKLNPGRAIILFREVLKIAPLPNAYFGLGMGYFADNQREKALDMITQLKTMGQEDLANKLEKAVRENKKVLVDQFNKAADDEDSAEDKSESNVENNQDADQTKIKTESPAVETPNNSPRGIKVRLRGRLNEL